MKIDVRYEGPYDDNMVRHGAIDTSAQGYDGVYVGRGICRNDAAEAALSEVRKAGAVLYAEVSEYLEAITPAEHSNHEGDGSTHYVYCILRVTP